MRRELRIRVAFEPTRLGKEHLHQAYEVIGPVQRRRVREEELSTEHIEDQTPKQSNQKRSVS